jgi:NADH:ubiquinone oxidoreductase subunit 6 (subunit J)
MANTFGIVAIASYAGAAALLVALVACFLRRWRLAATLAAAAAAEGAILVLVLVGSTAIQSREPVDPSLRATMLAAGISEAVNCAVVPLAVAALGGVVWRVARRRRVS